MVRHRPASSRTELATVPPPACSLSHPAGAISKPVTGTSAAIRRSDNAMPIRPSPMSPTGAFACMLSPPLSLSRLLGFNAGGLGIGGPSDNLASDKGAELVRTHRGNDHADIGELLTRCGHGQEFLALGMEFAHDRPGRSRRRE